MAWSDEVTKLLDDITEIFTGTITLKVTTQGAWDSSSGARAGTETTQSVLANRLPQRHVPITMPGGSQGRVEEVVYEVQASLITIGGADPSALSQRWRIADASLGGSGFDFEVLMIERDAERKNYIFTARRSG